MESSDSKQAFLDAYDQFADAIFRHCFFRTGDRERARDLTQETFTRAWEYTRNGGEIKSTKAFLYRVANNLIVDNFRKKKSYSLDELQEDGFDPREDVTVERETLLDAKAALRVLELLDSTYRDVITMRYVDDLSPGEIAEILHQTENAVSVRIYRGLRKARALLEAQEQNQEHNHEHPQPHI